MSSDENNTASTSARQPLSAPSTQSKRGDKVRTSPIGGSPTAGAPATVVDLLEGASADSNTDRSPYLVKRLFETSNKNLFNHVKFHLVKQSIDKLALARPRVLDIGCGLQVSRQYLEHLELDFDYCGIDYEPRFNPDVVVDLGDMDGLSAKLPWKPDVVLALDVLEHLHEDPEEVKKVVANIRSVVGDDTTIIVTLPQLYRLDRFKLPHLHYPEHKIRLTRTEWREILESEFNVAYEQGLGYLSVIPYLPMASRRYKPDNFLGSTFTYLRTTFFEWSPFKPIDLFLSNTLGKTGLFKSLSNDILFVAEPKINKDKR